MMFLLFIFLIYNQSLLSYGAITYALSPYTEAETLENDKAITYELPEMTEIEKAAVTYELNQGRFGDNLISYICAKQLALQLGLELLYVPFYYSDQLMLHTLEKQFNEQEAQLYEKKVIYNHKYASTYSNNNETLYITQWNNQPILDMYNEEIKKIIKELIKPNIDISYLQFPKDSISVAMHIRIGKGYDQEKTRKKHPHRFAPLHYFSDQLRRILFMFPDQKLHVHIFTDDPDPAYIVAHFKKIISSNLITYSYRKTENTHHTNVLEDFFNMMHFDVLIRPASNFSGLAQYLGNHKVVILPEELHFTGQNSWYVDTVQVVVKINDKHKIFGNVRYPEGQMIFKNENF